MEGRAEDSITVRLSGPGMYQWTLHKILNESKCEMISHSFCEALWSPETYCSNKDTFRNYFPEGLRLFRRVNLNDTLTHKILYPSGFLIRETESVFQRVAVSPHYDDPKSMISNTTDQTFCDTNSLEARAKNRERAFQSP